MYSVVVYFAGPLSAWSGKPHPREIIARRRAPWRWLALARAQALVSQLDAGRCGFVVTRGDDIVESVAARDPACNPLPGEAL